MTPAIRLYIMLIDAGRWTITNVPVADREATAEEYFRLHGIRLATT